MEKSDRSRDVLGSNDAEKVEVLAVA